MFALWEDGAPTPTHTEAPASCSSWELEKAEPWLPRGFTELVSPEQRPLASQEAGLGLHPLLDPHSQELQEEDQEP